MGDGPVSWLEQFGAGVGKVLLPVLEKRLDLIQAEAMAKIDTFLTEARKDIPEIGGAVAKAAIEAVFENTQIDETADRALGALGGILDRLGIRR